MAGSIEQNQKKTTNIQDLIGNREERHQKIQLWSNLYESEYALRLAIAAVDDYEDLFLAKGPISNLNKLCYLGSDCKERSDRKQTIF